VVGKIGYIVVNWICLSGLFYFWCDFISLLGTTIGTGFRVLGFCGIALEICLQRWAVLWFFCVEGFCECWIIVGWRLFG